MNANMQKILEELANIRNLDNWPDSEEKKHWLEQRKLFNVRSNKTYKNFKTGNLYASTQYFDPLGKEMSYFEYFYICPSLHKHVQQTLIEGTTVSTVWLCMNHAFGHSQKKIFETMIFGDPNFEDYMERYETLEEAEDGHKKAVELVKKNAK